MPWPTADVLVVPGAGRPPDTWGGLFTSVPGEVGDIVPPVLPPPADVPACDGDGWGEPCTFPPDLFNGPTELADELLADGLANAPVAPVLYRCEAETLNEEGVWGLDCTFPTDLFNGPTELAAGLATSPDDPCARLLSP